MAQISSIPYDDFGGHGQMLHLAHANAYPPGCYRQLLARLAVEYRVIAIHHRPLWAGSRPKEINSWQPIAEDIVRFFKQEGLYGVIGVGHSLGAVATSTAAVMDPSLFRALILIEPVFLSPAVLQMLNPVSTGDKTSNNPRVKTARRRRDLWESRQEAFDHFRQKSVFARFSDETLWDYVTYGLTKDNGTLHLTYRPAWEARIYALYAIDVWKTIPYISQPTLALRGAETDILMADAWQLWQELQPQATFTQIKGAGHLLPLEQPAEVARAIDAFLEDLNRRSTS